MPQEIRNQSAHRETLLQLRPVVGDETAAREGAEASAASGWQPMVRMG
jgi:hypothetical protein